MKLFKKEHYYKILESYSKDYLVKEVNKHLNEGWKCTGGISHVIHGQYDHNREVVYLQALTLRKLQYRWLIMKHKVTQTVFLILFFVMMYGIIEVIESYERDVIMTKHDSECVECIKILEGIKT